MKKDVLLAISIVAASAGMAIASEKVIDDVVPDPEPEKKRTPPQLYRRVWAKDPNARPVAPAGDTPTREQARRMRQAERARAKALHATIEQASATFDAALEPSGLRVDREALSERFSKAGG